MRSKSLKPLFISMIAIIFCVAHFVCADGLTWTQNNWTNGSETIATSTGLILKTKSNWYNNAWKYRQAVSVTNNSGSDLSNYQIPIYINTAELIGDSKMTADCRDIRVVDSNGNALPIWIATSPTNDTCNQTATKLWVKVSSLPAAGTSLYVYYGNSAATAVSNGNTVFPMFADFTTGSSLPDGWTTTDIGTAGSATVGGGVLTISNTNGEDVWEDAYGATHVYSTSTVSNSFIAETLVNSQTGSETWAKAGISVQNTVAPGVDNGQAFIVTTPGNGVAFQYQFVGGERCPGGICEPGLIAANVQINGGSYSFPSFLKLTKNNSNQVSGYYSSNGSTWNQEGDTLSPLGVTDTQYLTLFVTPHTISGSSTATYSFFYVRSYSDSEPTVSAPQNEEGFYLSSGSLISSIFDTGSATDFGSASYSYTAATNTTVVLKIRTSNNADMSGSSDFSSCDPITSGSDISANNCVKDRQRYVQYQISLTSSNGIYTPKFTNFSLDYAPTPTYTLNYSASTGGTISGSSTQKIYYGDSGSTVTVEPKSGYYFSGWDDGYKNNSRTDTNIKADFSALARFTRNAINSCALPSTPKVSVEPSLSNGVIDWSVANVYQMAVSESSDFSKSSWLPYETSYKNSSKTLYIKFRSPDGGESKVYIISPEVISPQIISPKKNNLTTSSTPTTLPTTSLATPAKISVQAKKTFKFKNDLKLGFDSPDVKELQKFLNTNGFLITTKGIGAPGQEGTYFGRLTKIALIKFQKANNISPASGFFGPITRKIIMEKINK